MRTTNVDKTENPYIDGLLRDKRWGTFSYLPKTTTISYSFCLATDSYDWTPDERRSMRNALNTWASIANIQFEEERDNNLEATLRFYGVDNNAYGEDTLGVFFPPGDEPQNQLIREGTGLFNFQHPSWNRRNIISGGSLGFVTLIHELGHGLGLAHPHDNGSHHGEEPVSSIYPGVISRTNPVTGQATHSIGEFGLNQGIYTTMSYNDGLNESGFNPGTYDYGYQGTPMAFDIAAIQYLYGVNNNYNSRRNTYFLPTSNEVGTMYSSIWDTGGADKISASGAKGSATINLNDATLDRADGAGAGGYLSYIDGIFGGFTIANGVVIENADGGNFNDTIIGNEFHNILNGVGGNDFIEGGGGNDTIQGGSGNKDYAVYSGRSSQYQIRTNSNGSYTISDNNSNRDGTDTLTEIEYLQFSDEYISVEDATRPSTPNNDNFANRISVGNRRTIRGTNIGSTSERREPNQSGEINSVWWSWTAPTSSRVTIDTIGSNFDTFLSVFTGNRVNSLTKIDSNDDINRNSNRQSRVSFDAVAGKTYQIAVDGYEDKTGEITLNVTTDNTGSGNNNIPTSGDDTLEGTRRDDLINGKNGNDNIIGARGDDTLIGGKGNDTLIGGKGNDNLIGGQGNKDYAMYSGRFAQYQIRTNSNGSYTIIDNTSNRDGRDTLTDVEYLQFSDKRISVEDATTPNGSGNNNTPTSGNDTLEGTRRNDLIDGQNGNDNIFGDRGHDTLIGGRGNDSLIGGQGDDSLIGGRGNDILTGGYGNDAYRFDRVNEGVDTIEDFSVRNDSILIRSAGFDGLSGTGSISSRQLRIGASATTRNHRFVYNPSNGDLFYDANGNRSGGLTQLASLDSGLALTNQDIILV